MPRALKIMAFLMLATSGPVLAHTAAQSHESILGAITSHIESNFRHVGENHAVEVAPLDQRLQLPQCDQPLVVSSMPGSREIGNISVVVKCPGTQPWSIYGRAYVRLYKQVAVLRGTVRQGTILSTSDVDTVQKDAAMLRGGYLTPDAVIGKPVRKTLSAGTVLLPTHLTTIKLVKRGQQVAIRAQNTAFEVSMAGVALMDGEAGQRIRVRNAASQRVVEGLVTADGEVSVAR
ncbi:MAG: hypothetical protein H6R26_1831 [Proteobacteria bacterium]|nr:hypothetical protein [Pseudomonadota bacterium]